MADLPETATYDVGVYQKETNDIAMGGPDGKANAGIRNLANRTAYLKQHLDSLETIVPQAEAEAGTATIVRAWNALRVRQAINVAVASVVNSAPAVLDTLSELAAALGNDASFAANVANALALKAPISSPAFAGDPTTPTPSLFNNGGSVASTAFVKKVLGNFSGYYYLDASTELSVTHLGGFINLGGNTPNQIYTLPGLSSTLDATMSPGLWLCNISGQPVMLKGWENETIISPRGAGNTLILAVGESCFVSGNDAQNWNIGGLTLAIGVGQTNRDKTAERAMNTTYTNSSYSPIAVTMSITNSVQAHAIIRVTNPYTGEICEIIGSGSYLGYDQACTVSAIVPPFHTYRGLTNIGTASLINWSELY
ncbi:hypothetical protein B0F88_103115 [Methylobacter tundripaludum]|uniref:Tail fiber-like repeat protein n=1 Tax=Methylobacter tundripaludum TaxID=173365 RepID=A0A2S6H5B9_9GAMM|nr:hypothetical protein [Methylobacter tundripaludum]PPK72682.1 hypothetical protein B0F88_103115 [Methylobacter tundripaludum]